MKSLAALVVFLVFGLLFKSHPAVLSTETSADPTITPTPSGISTPSTTPKPKVIIFPTPTVTLTVTVTLADWQYPSSNKVGDNKWESHDDAKTITDWYVNKIKSMGLPVTSFVKTNTNDKILNSLAAAKDSWKIKITIAQDSSDAAVVITIDNS